MKKRLILSAFLALILEGQSSLAFAGIAPLFKTAQEMPFCSSTPVDFLEPLTAIAEFGLAANVISSSFRIKDKNGSCSAARISDQGHILTAAHCVQECVREKINRPGASKDSIFCDIEIKGKKARAKVLVTYPCDLEIASIFERPLRRVRSGDTSESLPKCDEAWDLSILEVPAEALGDAACLPIKLTDVPLGEDVIALGYPSKSNRKQYDPEAKDSAGNTQYLSIGKIVEQEYCQGITELGRLRHKPEIGQKLEKQDQLIRDHDHMREYQTTVDVVPGSSGGPLIDRSGAIIGVARWGDARIQNNNVECPGATFFSRLSVLQKNIDAWNPKFSLSTVKCEKLNAIAPVSSY